MGLSSFYITLSTANTNGTMLLVIFRCFVLELMTIVATGRMWQEWVPYSLISKLYFFLS